MRNESLLVVTLLTLMLLIVLIVYAVLKLDELDHKLDAINHWETNCDIIIPNNHH